MDPGALGKPFAAGPAEIGAAANAGERECVAAPHFARSPEGSRRRSSADPALPLRPTPPMLVSSRLRAGGPQSVTISPV